MARVLAVLALLLLAPPAHAGPLPDHGFQWATIGDPGNPPTDPAAKHPLFPRPLGAVDYRYRMAVTEVTAQQAVEFLNAYSPYANQDQTRNYGADIRLIGFNQSGPVWDVVEGREQRPGTLPWRMWARYVNWLENDKALTEGAFAGGVYDASTFGVDQEGDLTDDQTRAPGARFFMPTIDEWTKAVYWDPDRHGPGEGGYWRYTYASDEPPDRDETNAGIGQDDPPLDVGSYPGSSAPWGLLDASGGQEEFIEGLNDSFHIAMGSRAFRAPSVEP